MNKLLQKCRDSGRWLQRGVRPQHRELVFKINTSKELMTAEMQWGWYLYKRLNSPLQFGYQVIGTILDPQSQISKIAIKDKLNGQIANCCFDLVNFGGECCIENHLLGFLRGNLAAINLNRNFYHNRVLWPNDPKLSHADRRVAPQTR
jgi:hypothetical protein